MPKKIWGFKQMEYIEKHGLAGQEDGVCLALAARWAKMRLKKQGHLPNEDGAARTGYFEKKGKTGKQPVRTVIADMQAAYDRVREPAKDAATAIEADVEAAFDKWFKNELSDQEYHKVKQDLENLADDYEKGVANALECLFARQNLTVVAKATRTSFQEYFKGVQDKACYVFKCHDLKHAFAGYFQTGWVWDDFYLFDPNCGEIHMDGTSDMEQFMAALKDVFKTKGYAERFQVRYARG